MDASVEEVTVRLPKQTVQPRQGREVVGSVEVEGLRTTPSLVRGVQPESSHMGDHPTDQRKGREYVQVQVIPRMTKRILENGLGIQDKRAIKGQFCVETCCKMVDRRIAPNAKQ